MTRFDDPLTIAWPPEDVADPDATIEFQPVPRIPKHLGTQANALAEDNTVLRKIQPDGVRDAPDDTMLTEAPPAPPAPPPRGLRADGTVRASGWLQLGGWMISSGVWAALVGFAAGMPLLPWHFWFPVLFALLGYGLWKIATQWVWPSSPAVNQQRVRAEELRPGLWIRLHGAIGPVGRVDQVITERHDWTRVRFTGGTYRDLPAQAPCHIVELRG
jgi:hypothetical protein